METNIKMKINKDTDTLLVVDVQNDFVTGSLAVPGAIEIIPVINDIIPMFSTVIYSRDAHIKKHPSFQAQGGPWPEHCVINSPGYQLHKNLMIPDSLVVIINKGLEEEAYSVFAGSIMIGSGYKSLADLLNFRITNQIFVCGLATDYCVKATVLDALKLFDGKVYVIRDAIRAVNLLEDDGTKAIKEMADTGALLITSDSLEN